MPDNWAYSGESCTQSSRCVRVSKQVPVYYIAKQVTVSVQYSQMCNFDILQYSDDANKVVCGTYVWQVFEETCKWFLPGKST